MRDLPRTPLAVPIADPAVHPRVPPRVRGEAAVFRHQPGLPDVPRGAAAGAGEAARGCDKSVAGAPSAIWSGRWQTMAQGEQ